MFYRSLTKIEQDHIAEAFTFELGKCYEQAIKERQLEVLALIFAVLRPVLPALAISPPTRTRSPTCTVLRELCA